MVIRPWYTCFAIAFILLFGLVEVGYGQTRTYLTGQKTGNKVAPPGISLGTGSAGLTAPMIEHNFLGFKFYKGPINILNDIINKTTVRAAQDLGLLGVLGAGGNAYIQFRVTGNSPNLPAYTPVYFTLKDKPKQGGLTLAVGGLLGLVELQNVFGRGYVNAVNYNENLAGSENPGTQVGSQEGTKSRFLVDKDGFWYMSVLPDAAFNSVRLNVQIPSDLRVADIGRWVSVDVYNAFTESIGSMCSTSAGYTSPGEASGISLNTGVLGLNLSDLIANPHHAIQDNNDYASYSSGISLNVANTVSQTIYFDHAAQAIDGVRVKLALSNSLIGVDLDLTNLNSVNFVAYNGVSETPVWSQNLYSLAQLLGLDLLNLINLGSNHKELDVVFKPGVAFDRMKIEFNAGLLGLGVLGDALRVYNVSLAPSAPEILEAGQPNDLSICEGETASFGVTASVPIGSSMSYQWQIWNEGTMEWDVLNGATSSSLVLNDVPLTYNGSKYRVEVRGGNVGCEQKVYSREVDLFVKLTSGKPHLTITDVLNE